MFFDRKNKKLFSISSIIYEEARLGTEKLYKSLTETNSWEISNKTSFIITSFIYHFFYYRMIMLSKYSDSYISNILKDCLYEMTSHVTNKIEEKNELIDICNKIFSTLDSITKELAGASRETFQSLMLLQSKYFIANVDDIKLEEATNSVAILIINIHFGSLLDAGDTFLEKIN